MAEVTLDDLVERIKFLEESIKSLLNLQCVQTAIYKNSLGIQKSKVHVRILLALAEGPMSIDDMIQRFSMKRNRVTKELTMMKKKFLFPYLLSRRENRRTIYELSPFGRVLVEFLRKRTADLTTFLKQEETDTMEATQNGAQDGI